MKALSCLSLALVVELVPRATLASGEPRVWAIDDGVRLRRSDVDSPLSRGEGNPVWRPGAPIHLSALRDEVVAIQIIVEAGAASLSDVSVDVSPLMSPSDASPAPSVDRFVEHYVEVKTRSRDDHRPAESLGWSPRARPTDLAMLGDVPDALVPVEIAKGFVPYPLAIRQRTLGAVWIDLTIPRDASPGRSSGVVTVRTADREIGRFDLTLDIADAVLPYRPVSFVAYYGAGELADRIGEGPAIERQFIQLLHRHHVDAFADLRSPDDVSRLAPALDGSLFTSAAKYVGPGVGMPIAAVALGAYGAFGEPDDAALAKVQAIVPRIPTGVEDVVLYAIDEDCDSDLGPRWRARIHATPGLERVLVAHSCSRDPRTQDVDLALVAADHFDSEATREARARGPRVWVYNGALPRSGTLLLDADPTGLRVDGWIAATHAIGRWFFWETTFWNDDNSGGRGPIDPFATAESFHNKHGDHAMLDGLLVYPGTQTGKFAVRSLGFRGVLPSIRLKNLRRGIEDAGYFALARSVAPAKADAIARKLLPAALDEAKSDDEPSWYVDAAAFGSARDALRALIPKGASLDRAEVATTLVGAAETRRADVPIAWDFAWSRKRKIAALGAAGSVLLCVLAAVRAIVGWRRRARARRIPAHG